MSEIFCIEIIISCSLYGKDRAVLQMPCSFTRKLGESVELIALSRKSKTQLLIAFAINGATDTVLTPLSRVSVASTASTPER